MNRIFFILLSAIAINLSGQDPVFSQYFNADMNLNPARVGTMSGWVSNIQNRNQWVDTNGGGFHTLNLGIQKSIDKYNSGIGLNINYDRAGESLQTYQLGLVIAKRIQLKENFRIGLGLNTEITQKYLATERLTFSDNIDPNDGFTSSSEPMTLASSVTVLNLSSGVDIQFFKLNLGYSLFNLNRPNLSFGEGVSRWPIRHALYSKYEFEIDDNSAVVPMILFQTQGDFNQVNFCVNYRYKWLNVLAGYRNEDAIIVGTGVGSKRLRFQYSYDITIGKLAGATGGAHELGLIFRFGSKTGYDDYNGAY